MYIYQNLLSKAKNENYLSMNIPCESWLVFSADLSWAIIPESLNCTLKKSLTVFLTMWPLRNFWIMMFASKCISLSSVTNSNIIMLYYLLIFLHVFISFELFLIVSIVYVQLLILMIFKIFIFQIINSLFSLLLMINFEVNNFVWVILQKLWLTLTLTKVCD